MKATLCFLSFVLFSSFNVNNTDLCKSSNTTSISQDIGGNTSTPQDKDKDIKP